MYCILVAGVPASGKSTMAAYLAKQLGLPMFSKDRIKEQLFDDLGFRSRDEKNRLGVAAMNIQYIAAEQLMEQGMPFILENNFEHISKDGLMRLLEKYHYTAITVMMAGEMQAIYQRFLARDKSPERHRGHVVNTCYPEPEGQQSEVPIMTYEDFAQRFHQRGMDTFRANGPIITVDATDIAHVDREALILQLQEIIAALKEG